LTLFSSAKIQDFFEYKKIQLHDKKEDKDKKVSFVTYVTDLKGVAR